MKTLKPTVYMSLLAVFFTVAPAQAAKIYKWVDAQGHVHYSEHPTAAGESQQIHVQKAPSLPQQASPDMDVRGVPGPGDMPDSATEPECQTIACRANRLEAERLQREQARRQAQAASKKPKTQQQRNEEFQAAQQAALDKQLMEDCKRRRETYCDEGVDEIKRQLQLQHDEQMWDRMRKNREPDIPRYRGNDIYIN